MIPKLVIIEDDQALALAYEKKFTQAGFEVTRADDGRSGISRINETRPDIVILDIMLPGKINGFDVLRELKLSPVTKAIPVIVMTNLAEEGQSALELGAKEYLLKVNVSLQDLLVKVNQHLKDRKLNAERDATVG